MNKDERIFQEKVAFLECSLLLNARDKKDHVAMLCIQFVMFSSDQVVVEDGFSSLLFHCPATLVEVVGSSRMTTSLISASWHGPV